MAEKTEQIDFIWVGIDKTKNKTKGEISALNINIAKAELRRQGFIISSIKKKAKPLFTAKTKPITAGDIAIFARQLATMMEAGLPVVQAIDIVGKGNENPSMQTMLMDIKAEVETGSTLSEALGKYPIQFDELFRNLVKAGEQAGVLETLLER